MKHHRLNNEWLRLLAWFLSPKIIFLPFCQLATNTSSHLHFKQEEKSRQLLQKVWKMCCKLRYVQNLPKPSKLKPARERISSLSEVQEEPQLCLEDLEIALFSHLKTLFSRVPACNVHSNTQIKTKHFLLLTPHNAQHEAQNALYVINDQNGQTSKFGVWFGLFVWLFFWGGDVGYLGVLITSSHYGNHRWSFQTKNVHSDVIK